MTAEVTGTPGGQTPGTQPEGRHQPAAAIAVTGADRQYADLVSGLNQRYTAAPEAIRLATSTEQVVGVVQEAVRRGKRLSVRSSGHCYEDFVYHPDVQIILDMSGMRNISYDPRLNAIAIESGATNLQAYQTTYPRWGVVAPTGFCYSVAMGGHVSGGAWGPLCRTHGLVVDHLYAVEVVVVDAAGRARAVVATREEDDPHRDLWWAHTGGGGGNFGVVTRYWFRSPGASGRDPRGLLPRPPAELLVNAVSWPWAELGRADFHRLTQNYAEWHVANSSPDSPQRALISQLVLNHRSAGQIGMVALVDASVPDAEQILSDYLKQLGDGVGVAPGAMTAAMGELPALPRFAQARRLPWLHAVRMLGTTNSVLNDPTLRAEYKSSYMRAAFPDSHLEALYRHLTRDDLSNPNLNVLLTSYGGRINAVDPAATAAPHRGAAFKMLWQAFWNDPADDDLYIGWARDCYREVYADTGGVPVPGDVTDGCYVNYPDIDLGDPRFNTSSVPWHDLYYKENYPRLQQVKKRWDPRNVFRHAQSVTLPDA
ncbi:FAD-binding oxidoreductase [Streptomyces noursei]|uniref:FAD-binding oxidoreductase n=1 Tax=Streptomyces noursei TaxID=1971 RepID=UPI00081CCD39|nr:secreted FAD-binding protein [Streptomyces noursei ATCC 11455]MCZ0992534.1 FAD-binding oxidoreductase [Streptomyces noursei]